ncbi:hypothetical protein GY45DRAFT_1368688 [Cubamyces sp. BRFM 1775]|nr:hypothetical protein GY45DRAFT_1368688 [Cubamyces sp. BRFM 1775]
MKFFTFILSVLSIVVLNAFSAVAQSVGAVIADLRGLIATTRDLSDIVYDLTPDDIAYQGPQILTELFHISDELIRTTNDAEEAAAQGPLPPPAADAVNDLYTEFAFTYLYLAGLINQNILDVDDLGAGGEVVQHFVLVELMHQEGLIDALSDAIESLIPDSAMVNATNALNSINGTIAKAAAAMNVSS